MAREVVFFHTSQLRKDTTERRVPLSLEKYAGSQLRGEYLSVWKNTQGQIERGVRSLSVVFFYNSRKIQIVERLEYVE
jgi:hypothetical protein